METTTSIHLHHCISIECNCCNSFVKDHLLDSKGFLIFAVIITTLKYVCALYPNSLQYDAPLRQTIRERKLDKKYELLIAEIKMLEEEEAELDEQPAHYHAQSQSVNLQDSMAKKSGKLAWMNL